MLARVNDPQAGVPLVGLLRDEDEAVRKAGASALEHMAGVLDETTAAALTSLLYASKDEGIRVAASQLLGGHSECDRATLRDVDPSGPRGADHGRRGSAV